MPASTLEPTPLPPTAPRCPACGNSMRLEGSAPSTHYVNRDQFKYVCDCGDTAEKTVAWQPHGSRTPQFSSKREASLLIGVKAAKASGVRFPSRPMSSLAVPGYGAPMTADQL